MTEADAIPLAVVVGSPFTRTVNGQAYTFSPLTLADLGEFQRFALDRALDALANELATIEKIAGENLELAAKRGRIDSIYRDSESGMLEALAATKPAGIAQYLWLSLRHRQPALTVDTVAKTFGVQEARELREALDRASGLVEDQPESSGEGDVKNPPPAGSTGEASPVS